MDDEFPPEELPSHKDHNEPSDPQNPGRNILLWSLRQWQTWRGKQHWPYMLCQFGTLLASLYWLKRDHLPWPGVAVAIIAVLAALMSIDQEITGRHKFVYFALMAGLLITEFRAIRKDREENEKQQQAFFNQQKSGFKQISDQAQVNFQATANGLQSTIDGMNGILGTTEDVARLSKENLEELSGQGSHPCIVPQPAPNGSPVALVIWNRGKNPLAGVEVRLVSQREFLDGHSILYKPSANIGTLRQEWPKPIPEPILPVPNEKGIANYTAEIWTQNGYYTEVINFTPGRYQQWSYQYFLTNQTIMWRRSERAGMKGTPVSDCNMGWSDDRIAEQKAMQSPK